MKYFSHTNFTHETLATENDPLKNVQQTPWDVLPEFEALSRKTVGYNTGS